MIPITPASTFQQIMAQIQSSLQQLTSNALTAAQVKQITLALAQLIAQLQQYGLPQKLAQVFTEQMEQAIERSVYDPYQAADPAHQLIQALSSIKQEGVNLQQLFATARTPFKLSQLRIRRTLARQSRVAAANQVMGSVAGLALASGEAHLALSTLFHLHDPRFALAGSTPTRSVPLVTIGSTTSATVNSTTAAGYLVKLPSSLRGSEVHRKWIVRFYAYLIGVELAQEAQASIDRLQQASLDQIAYRPSAVAREAVQLLALVARAQLTCARLYELASA